MPESPPLRCQGFTLIELVIVLAIIGLVASIAYPSYASHVLRARRVEGQLALFEVMHRQESLYSRSSKYAAFTADTAQVSLPGVKWWSGATQADSAYEISAQACAGAALAQCVEAVATPGTERVDSRFRDADCGALTLASTGERRAETGKAGCWP